MAKGDTMKQLKRYKDNFTNKVNGIIDDGDIRRVNYISANFMLDLMAGVIMLFTILVAILNQLNVFTANKTGMWIAAGIAVIMIVPLLIYVGKTQGEDKNLHWILVIDLIVLCGMLTMLLGHNVVLLMVIPVVLSTRYYDKKFTRKVALITILASVLVTIGTCFLGVLNLNMCDKIIADTTLVVSSSLREAVEQVVRSGGDFASNVAAGTASLSMFFDVNLQSYIKSMLINEMAPRLIVYLVIAIACVQIAHRGDEMLRLQEEAGKKQSRIEGELNVATDIQNSMLPCIFPAFPDHQHLELFATYTPAKEVGGDFYDYFNIDKDHIAVVMADVSGKGVGAALFMTIAKIVLKNQLMSGLCPKDAVSETNRQLCENNDAGLFVTAWVGVYEISTCKMTFVNAGHNPPIIRRSNGDIDYLCERNGIVLAGFAETKYSQSTVELNKGDEIFLYTDGVTEANNISEDLYGEDRLIKVVGECAGKECQEQLKIISADINKFIGQAEQFDDITMMVLKIK